ncbi:hypothetical protein A2U01_0116027, partial [Trifolium medium]|nr:hypothetical protein [Trifolium medium]
AEEKISQQEGLKVKVRFTAREEEEEEMQ